MEKWKLPVLLEIYMLMAVLVLQLGLEQDTWICDDCCCGGNEAETGMKTHNKKVQEKL